MVCDAIMRGVGVEIQDDVTHKIQLFSSLCDVSQAVGKIKKEGMDKITKTYIFSVSIFSLSHK